MQFTADHRHNNQNQIWLIKNIALQTYGIITKTNYRDHPYIGVRVRSSINDHRFIDFMHNIITLGVVL